METFGLHGLILCVSECFLSELLCIHIVGKETFGLHVLILCVFEDLLSKLFCIHIACMETFDLHGLILCAFAHIPFSQKLYHIIVGRETFAPYLAFNH